MTQAPLISVMIEGYNDSLDLGSVLETVESLERQDYPLERVEIIIAGSAEQAALWRQELKAHTGFFRVEVVSAPGAHYYRLKNIGAEHARGDVFAFLDSDALPQQGWLRAIAEGFNSGAGALAGITLFRSEHGKVSLPLILAASISWGFIAHEQARGFLSHNVAFRREIFERFRYREDLGRTCAGSLLFDELVAGGVPMRFQPRQRVCHVFTFGWWLTRLHVRFGHEVFLLRRITGGRYGWARHLGWMEPFATAAWHVALDVPQWFRFSRLLGWNTTARIACVPLLVPLSFLARGAEAIGMLATLYAPQRMRRFALSN